MDISQIVIESDRLILRKWLQTDLQDLYAYASVEGVGEMAGWAQHKTLEDSQKVLTMFINDKNNFALVHKRNNKVIGSLGIQDSWANEEEMFSHLRIQEMGYALSKDYWGNGLMPEAVEAVMAYFFGKDILDGFTTGHFKTNDRSKRVIEKSGFTYVKSGEFYSNQLDKTFEIMQYIYIHDPNDNKY